MKIKYPDYKNSIANLSCSIMKYFGAEVPNSTLPAADMLLWKYYKNVVTVLLDGMGTDRSRNDKPADCSSEIGFLY